MALDDATGNKPGGTCAALSIMVEAGRQVRSALIRAFGRTERCCVSASDMQRIAI
jgi:hypothetical protein